MLGAWHGMMLDNYGSVPHCTHQPLQLAHMYGPTTCVAAFALLLLLGLQAHNVQQFKSPSPSQTSQQQSAARAPGLYLHRGVQALLCSHQSRTYSTWE